MRRRDTLIDVQANILLAQMKVIELASRSAAETLADFIDGKIEPSQGETKSQMFERVVKSCKQGFNTAEAITEALFNGANLALAATRKKLPAADNLAGKVLQFERPRATDNETLSRVRSPGDAP